MIEIEGLKKSYGSLEVLKGIDLSVNNGEVISIIGASGSGKSTLLYCINALEPIQGASLLSTASTSMPNPPTSTSCGATLAWCSSSTMPSRI